MKILHTADLHLGKRFNDVSMLDDQKILLDQIIRIAEQEKPQVILLAGDIYQTSSPGSDAMELFNSFLTAVSALGIPVLMISGNHDSQIRISYLSRLLVKANVYASDLFHDRCQTVTFRDENGPVVFYLLPFMRPVQVRQAYPDQNVENSQEALKCVLAHSPLDPAVRNVLVCHLFAANAVMDGSEDDYGNVGTVDAVDTGLFRDFDYVALGHIHKPQKFEIKEGGHSCLINYSGSIAKYSFSETQGKSVSLVELGPKGTAPKLTRIPLTLPHDVKKITGHLEDILKMGSDPDLASDYLWIELTDDHVATDARQQLDAVFDHVLKISINNAEVRSRLAEEETESLEGLTETQIYDKFYEEMKGKEPDPEEKDIIRDVFETVRQKERGSEA